MSKKMDSENFNKNLLCILFPGMVKNVDKALECLGGIRAISQVYSNPTKKRLGLSFQPANPYVKNTFGDGKKTAGVLFKVKVKKVKDGNEVKREVVSTTVLGRVPKIYKFESMCDFQYLPVSREAPNGPLKCILEEIIPSGVDSVSFMTQPAQPFIVPSNFTRSDKPINYAYTDKRYPDRKESSQNEENIHNRIRSDRGGPLNRFVFNLTNELPTAPNECFLKQKQLRMAVYPQLEQEYSVIEKLFDERPIWSQNLLRYESKVKVSSLKIIVPCFSIYMNDGPWRTMWVKYGYDPRKDPGARIYQTLDFRIRHTAGVHSMVTTREQMTHYKKAQRVRHPTKSRNRDEAEAPVAEEVSEGAVRFYPGMVPAQRQVFYQFVDVKLPEVEELLAVEPAPGYLCHPKRGWLPHNASEIARNCIFKNIKQTLFSTPNSDLKLEDGSSDDENSDGDTSTVTEMDDTR